MYANDLPQSKCVIQAQKIEVKKSLPPSSKNTWEEVKTLPDIWASRWPDYNGDVWYRIYFDNTCSPKHTPIALVIEYINMAGEVYLNNQLLWKDEYLKEPLSRSWNMPRYWVILNKTFTEKNNVLLVHIHGYAKQSSGLGEVSIGSPKSMVDLYNQLFWNKRTIFLINLIVSCFLAIICLITWLTYKKDTTYLWFSIASFLWSALLFGSLSTTTLFFKSTFYFSKYNLICYLIYTISFGLFTWRFALKKYNRIEKIIFYLLFFSIIIVIITPEIYFHIINLLFFFIYTLFFLGFCIFFQFLTLNKKTNEMIILSICLFLYIIICLYEIFRIFSNNYSSISLIPYSSLGTMLTLCIIFSWKISKSIKYLTFFNTELSTRIEKAKLELSDSLEKRHRLELENSKLQERLSIAHELHDGLGGSLVRATLMIQNSKENLGKNQFLSYLNTLKSDLRQIIDTSSSATVAIPESPRIWGAPIRYRFIQIFEELNIDLYWDVLSEWIHKPSSSQLYMLSRILEEAFTNIIKHSQANKVWVELYENSHAELCLMVKDNGVGFNVESVLASGMSIGIQSILARAKRENAQIFFSSQPFQTTITLILKTI